MEESKRLTTQEKALRINLSKSIYGSFAEIGAGQEVAANFFKVGGGFRHHSKNNVRLRHEI